MPRFSIKNYSRRKAAGRKPGAMPGGLNPKIRHQIKSISKRATDSKRTTQPKPIRRIRRANPLVHQLLENVDRRKRYQSIERVLDDLRLKHPLKRQAVHSACETAIQERDDLATRLHDLETRYEQAAQQLYEIRHPKDRSVYSSARKIKPPHKYSAQTIAQMEHKADFLLRLWKSTQRELNETYHTTPQQLETIFGKKSSPIIWKMLTKVLFPTHQDA